MPEWFSLLRPTRSRVRIDKPLGFWIPKIDFAGGRIIDSSLLLKIAKELDYLIS